MKVREYESLAEDLWVKINHRDQDYYLRLTWHTGDDGDAENGPHFFCHLGIREVRRSNGSRISELDIAKDAGFSPIDWIYGEWCTIFYDQIEDAEVLFRCDNRLTGVAS